MTKYARVHADANTPIEDNRRILGWNGSGGDFRHWTQASWHQTTAGTQDFIPGANGPLKYYGIFLFWAWISTADEWDLYLHTYNGDNTLASTVLMSTYKGNYRSSAISYLFQLEKDQYAKIQYRVKAGGVKKTDIGYSVYVQDRTVGEDIEIQLPEFETKLKTLTALLQVDGQVVDSASQAFSYLSGPLSNEITIGDDYKGNHINLWDFYKSKNGKEPGAGEEITFIIPETRTFIAPFGYTASTRRADINIPGNSVHKGYSYQNENTIAGYPAVSLKGWDKSLGNKITIDFRGKAIGSFMLANDPFMRPFDKATGLPIDWYTFRNMGWVDILAAWWFCQYLCGKTGSFGNTSSAFIALSNPIKNPAFYTEVDCTVIVRQGAYILGGGGNQTTLGMYNRVDVPSSMDAINGVTEDNTNVHAGDAIHAGGSNNTVKIENYGYISGGGGGGASAGREAAGLLDNSAVFAQGGLGAPLSNIYAGAFPAYIDLAYVKTLPVVPKTLGNNYTGLFDLPPDFMDPNPLPDTNNIIEMSEARIIRAVDLSKAGYDQYGDNIYDIESVNYSIANSNRLLSPTPGIQVTTSNNYNSVISGSGGAPGVDGQKATIVKAGSSWLNSVPNTPGRKGQITVDKGSNNNFVVNNYPGSLFNR